MSLQPKLLRAVEYGRWRCRPLGSNKPPARVDVRLVCATNRDLPAQVRQGRFRDDLYYRVGVMTIEAAAAAIVAKSALEVLAHVFRERACERHGKKEVARLSRRRRWPRWSATTIRATCASCATPSSTR